MSTALKDLTGTFTIDPSHSQVGFVARHAVVTKVRGSFEEFEGAATTGPNLAGAKINLTIRPESVNTRDAKRDDHLRTSDFFEVGTYPTITFESTDVTPVDGETLRVVGDLTIKDTTKPVTIDFTYNGAVTDMSGNLRAGFEGSTVVNRSDFGLKWNVPLDAGGVLVSEKITLDFEIAAVRQDA